MMWDKNKNKIIYSLRVCDERAGGWVQEGRKVTSREGTGDEAVMDAESLVDRDKAGWGWGWGWGVEYVL